MSSRGKGSIKYSARCSGGGAIPPSDKTLIGAANEIADLPGFDEILDKYGIEIERDRNRFEALAEYPAQPPRESRSGHRKK